MGWKLTGNSGSDAEVEANHRSLRATIRPIDWGSLGSYIDSVSSGTMAAGLAAESPIYSFRWSNATNVCAVRSVRMGITQGTTQFAAGFLRFEMVVARSFTVSDTGGTVATPTGNFCKLRTSMGTSLVGDIRHSLTATLTAGTRSLDTGGVGNMITTASTVAAAFSYPGATPTQFFLFGGYGDGGHPLVLAQNEGFIIKATVPATGTWAFTVITEWSELSSY